MNVTGHRVLVTGASSGIGRSLARAFHAAGNRVAGVARRRDRLDALAYGLPGFVALPGDVADPGAAERLVAEGVAALGGLSVLVNNAGVQFNDRQLEADPETLARHAEQEVATNVTGLVRLTAYAVPHLAQAPAAAIVNVSSVLALQPKRSAPVYCATKAAVQSYTKALRYQLAEVAPHIRVFDLAPGLVDTEMTRRRTGEKTPPEVVARELLDAMEREQFDVYPAEAKRFARLNRWFPARAARRMRDR